MIKDVLLSLDEVESAMQTADDAERAALDVRWAALMEQCRHLTPQDRVFFVSQGDNGERWFSAVFDFYPVLVDYSGIVSEMIGGGASQPPRRWSFPAPETDTRSRS